jgi:hypothetical protein
LVEKHISLKISTISIVASSSTMKHFPLKDKDVIDVTIVEGSSKVFGDKLAKEVFGAKGFPFLEVKGHGASLDVRLLKLRL